MRLDKFISIAMSISRSDAKRLISKKQILVNQLAITDKQLKVSQSDKITYQNTDLAWPSLRYYMLNKPAGYVCSTVDESNPSALRLLPSVNPQGLHFAGRLDSDTTGLVLVTDDGQWSHRITSPASKQNKSYLVTLAEALTPPQYQRLLAGVKLKDSNKLTRPALVDKINEQQIRLSISEGRYHQVKRMLAAVGNHVTALHRVSIGELILDETLEEGGWRPLSKSEVELF